MYQLNNIELFDLEKKMRRDLLTVIQDKGIQNISENRFPYHEGWGGIQT